MLTLHVARECSLAVLEPLCPFVLCSFNSIVTSIRLFTSLLFAEGFL